jgi:cyclohexyl-isocyanide hydratase
MSEQLRGLRVVIALFPGVTHLDFTGPHQFFARIPNVDLIVASEGGRPVGADGLVFSGLAVLEDLESCDLLCVPGGYGVAEAIHCPGFMGSIGRLAESASYVCSVCTGSIILAAAGLLRGRRAACHWAWREMLALFPDVEVVNDRVVRDGHFFTGGGVTAGIDMALTVIAEILGPAGAQAIQLGLEYAPQPPFDSGRPESAPAEIGKQVRSRVTELTRDKRKLIEEFIAG